VLDSVPQGVFWKNRDSVYVGCNQVFADATGLADPASVAGKTDFDLTWSRDEAIAYRADDADVVAHKRSKRHILEPLRLADGQVRWIDTSKVPLIDERGEVYGVLGIYDDVTERRQAEDERDRLREQLQQAAKMEAVGRLAGGVAHDFNNLLTAILGNVEMAQEETGAAGGAAPYLEEIRKAAESAASLTRQLLAFSRKQMVEPRTVNLNDLVGHLQPMLGRLIGEDVVMEATLASDLAPVRVDPAQFQQALVNLAVNARDAMPGGGTLSITTANVVLDPHYCASHPHVMPGPFVMVAVTDTGAGMTDEVRRRVFEPFFTTKPKGRGTGLGLATTFGTVTQAGGTIEVYSEPGLGSTFKIYLPQSGGTAPARPEPPPAAEAVGGRESILLVEDDEAVRLVAKGMLERLGYDVRCAAGGPEALRLTEDDPRPIDLLLTDVVMPGMNGRELADRLAARFPGMRTLFASGYTEDAIVHRGMVDATVHFIPKPFTSDGLSAKVRQVLDAPPPA
jgi:PAS domain S-box-containing protein